ncbi:similar to Saccharomyces cerevisiae YCL027W FUS1 Membrane protein localized to the shmoo tip, required for cell fusion [Maudiozyma barnettii]|uniref:Similar to Saccharomyces cerevisiae YCL027W FUS1 Membrane protein localized to the shmoo tip, required for cell fusion n=1 Tax=Maudiozyma barnettii TaxID=61262 RepID=A0A8H2VEB2_9SACH|nr:Fus1p [Kazachstania barnettii]CAB4253321.1 similar to Saccharomyces cerevisiae YCL027W FUS1 Membrane protein localized to the shmoo tip, required for cell fusion [Kazachstania barnettii]CAD1780834.1 similar to Saccharomyces cerevisiae YCL027W FUS1 Membrane protein localized to the shmoo tip, required for cell fusion [Kazachstania barnettii]
MSPTLSAISLTSISSTATVRQTEFTTEFLNLPTFSSTSKTSSSTTIGLSVGVPVGIFVFSLIICLLYVYIKREKLHRFDKTLSPRYRNDASKGSPNFLSMCFVTEKNNPYDLEQNSFLEKPWLFENNNFSSKLHYDIPGVYHNVSDMVPHVLTPAKATTIDDRYKHQKKKYIIPFDKMENIIKLNSTKPQVLEVNEGVKRPITTFGNHWKYKSPLSKWFLNSSNDLTTESQTPNARVKRLHVLSKVDKGYADDVSEVNVDEKSPILQVHNQSYKMLVGFDSVDETSPENDMSLAEHHRASVIYDELKKSITSTSVVIDPVISYSTSTIDVNGRKKRRDSRFKQCGNDTVIDLVSHSEELIREENINPESQILKGGICIVSKSYSPRLTDEIQINKDGYVRVLATHTDTWCLVEKCQRDGTSIPGDETLMNNDITNLHYLNKNRGIVPGDCLQPI